MQWPPDPVALRFDHLAIRWYGIWCTLAFLVVTLHWIWRARREQRPASFGIDFSLTVTISGFVGSRIAHVLAHGSAYQTHPAEIFRYDRGGLIYYGGFLLAIGLLFFWARRRNESVWKLLDFGATGIPLAHAFGRLGCFFNDCCGGVACPPPWGWPTHGGGSHVPVQFGEALFLLLLYGVLQRMPLNGWPGRIFAAYIAGYGAWRFAAEFVRGDERMLWGPLNVAQWISLALLALSAWILVRTRAARGTT